VDVSLQRKRETRRTPRKEALIWPARRFNPAPPQLFRMISDYALDAVPQQNHVPVDDQPQRYATLPAVMKALMLRDLCVLGVSIFLVYPCRSKKRSAHFTLRSKINRRPSSVRLSSICWIPRDSRAKRAAKPPVAMTTVFSPRSRIMRPKMPSISPR